MAQTISKYRNELTINHDYDRNIHLFKCFTENGIQVDTMNAPVATLNGESISASSKKFVVDDIESIHDFMFPEYVDATTYEKVNRDDILLEKLFKTISENLVDHNVKTFVFYKLHGMLVNDRTENKMMIVWTLRGYYN